MPSSSSLSTAGAVCFVVWASGSIPISMCKSSNSPCRRRISSTFSSSALTAPTWEPPLTLSPSIALP
ncbi:hypothetical protein B484DRAFT_453348 [Ochromonadaceae sp. CCMP2298]|nr:hypothetical protein B484DRAFT_453348 [Ochromonadaceae sp. CCMP2298]